MANVPSHRHALGDFCKALLPCARPCGLRCEGSSGQRLKTVLNTPHLHLYAEEPQNWPAAKKEETAYAQTVRLPKDKEASGDANQERK